MRGVILAYSVPMTTLSVGDIVQPTDGYEDNIYTIAKIDPRYGKQPDDDDTPFKYFIASKDNGELMNFSKDELVKMNTAFFDYDKYFKEDRIIFLGAISYMDLNYIKAKKAVELDLGYSDIKNIHMANLVGMDFYGDITNKVLSTESSADNPSNEVITYFRIDKP